MASEEEERELKGYHSNMSESAESSDSFGEEASVDDEINEQFEVVMAIDDFIGKSTNQLSFHEGDKITIISRETRDWLWGELDGTCGYVPATYVRSVNDVKEQLMWQNEEYFGSYGHLKLHWEMLNDKVRTNAYRTAIQKHAKFIKDKVVLDVGCGTGILSMFSVIEGGAKKVYAVEASEIAEYTKQVVRHNKLDHAICVIKGRIEKIDLPEKVDMIISEWMGTFLVFEFMIDCVLYSRDQWLKPSGVVWPSEAEIHLVPCCAHSEFDGKINFWKDVYGIDFSPLKEKATEDFFHRPIHNHVLKPEHYLSPPMQLLKLDLSTLLRDALESTKCSFEFIVDKDETLHGFATWFSVRFGGLPVCPGEKHVVLSTEPSGDEPTHWKQNLFMLDNPLQVCVGDCLKGSAQIVRNPEFRRHLTVTFEFWLVPVDGSEGIYTEKKFFIWR